MFCFSHRRALGMAGTACAIAAGTVALAGVVQAADYFLDERQVRLPSVDVDVDVGDILRPPRRVYAYPDRPIAAIPRAGIDVYPAQRPAISVYEERPAVSPEQIAAILRATGYSPLGPLARRGRVYFISAIAPNGDDGRLVLDAHTGRIMRFVPQYDIRGDLQDNLQEDLRDNLRNNLRNKLNGPPAVYGRSGLPPIAETYPPSPSPGVYGRAPSSPPPAVAALPPSPPAARQSANAGQPAASPGQPVSRRSSAVATAPAATKPATRPAVDARAEMTPAKPGVLPTQQLPAVQPLE